MISIECFEGLPLEYESFLIERYDSIFTTCRWIEIYYPTDDISHMLVREDAKLLELFVYVNRNNICTCLNLLGTVNQDVINEFIKKIFEKYPYINKIEIVASYKSYSLEKSILVAKSNDYVLNLPATIEDYYNELGARTRKGMKSHKSKLLKDYPNVKFVTKLGADIDESIIDKIIQLNIDRMKFKGIVPGKDENDKKSIYKYSQYYGCVAYIEIDGAIVAGRIAYMLNENVFGHVIAHDDNFAKYNLGQMCQFYMIQIAIEKRFSTFHFLWGNNEFKTKLLAKPQMIFSYLVYRTYSVDYFFNGMRMKISRGLSNIKQSDLLKPLRNAIKSYRSKKWNE